MDGLVRFYKQIPKAREILLSLLSDNEGEIPELKSGKAWDDVLREARLSRISPLIYRRLKKRNVPSVPDKFKKAVKRDYLSTLAFNLWLLDELNKLLKNFRVKGIKAIVLKGAFLAEKVYPDPGLRPMTDLDLLVRREEMASAHTVLETGGFQAIDQRRSHFPPPFTAYLNSLDYRRPGRTFPSIHLHWHLVNSGTPAPMFTEKVNMDKVWKEAVEIKMDGIDVLTLSPHHMLLHLCEHGLRVRHSLSQLILLFDIDRIIKYYGEELRWERVIEEGRAFGWDKLCFISLYAARRFVHAPVRPEIIKALWPEKLVWEDKIFYNLLKGKKQFPGASYFIYLGMNRGVFNKIRFILSTFFPPGPILAQRRYSSDVKNKYYWDRLGEVFSSLLRFF